AVFYAGEANYLNEQGDYQGALAILQMAENRGCIDEYTLNIKAKVLSAMGRGAEASKLRQEQIDKGTRHAASYSDEALYLNDQGDREGALKILGKAESFGCANKYTFAIKTKVLTAMGRETEASHLRREQIDKGSQDEIFYNDEAMYLIHQGDPEGALKILQKAERNACTNEYTFAIKAKVLAAMGREIEASRLRREQIDKGSRNIAFYNDEAKYLKQQGDSVGALDVLRRATDVGCADAYSIVTKAVVLEGMGRGAEASTLRMEQIAKGIRDAAFYNDEAKYLKDQGMYEAALEVIQKSEIAECLDDYTLAIKAGVLAALGRESEAAEVRRKEMDKGSQNPAFYTDEAKFLSSQGDLEGALAVLLISENMGVATEYTSALKDSLLKSLGRKDSSTKAVS
ncbi:MAG: hypothetical protein Q8K68_04090, partial [Nitrospirota bacterium]|nr:hypothetical protein [Nitrospirota bacterium]